MVAIDDTKHPHPPLIYYDARSPVLSCTVNFGVPEQGAEYASADFFKAKISNPNTRKDYKRTVDRFLGWCQLRGLELWQLTSFFVGEYVEHHLVDKDGHPLSPPTKKQHLAALRHFFDNQQMYHGVAINPASSVRGPRYSARAGKTPAFDDRKVRQLRDSIDTGHVVGVRDKTLLMILADTAARAGAVAKLRTMDYVTDGWAWSFHLGEKGGNLHHVRPGAARPPGPDGAVPRGAGLEGGPTSPRCSAPPSGRSRS